MAVTYEKLEMPLPKLVRGPKGCGLALALRNLAVGEAIKTSYNLSASAATAASKAARHMNDRRKYATRKLPDGTIGIWRTK